MNTSPTPSRIVLLCDWLPPDFGAVGQYAVGFARELAMAGHQVSLVGFSSSHASCETEHFGAGQVLTRRLHRPAYDRNNFFIRAWWTLGANLALLWGARRELRGCDEIRFTGSPPYLIHFVMPLAIVLRARTRYRITDFHPECLVAALGRSGPGLKLLGTITNFWRRRVDVIEVLGNDQARRLAEAGIATETVLRRDPSPVQIDPGTVPAARPPAAGARKIVLYSGNWGSHMTTRLSCRAIARSVRSIRTAPGSGSMPRVVGSIRWWRACRHRSWHSVAPRRFHWNNWQACSARPIST